MIILPLAEINPFDPTHWRIDEEPGWCAVDKTPGEHLLGARRCAELLARGVAIRPIAVCAADLVPADRRNDLSDRPWQRLDGFKRYFGHVLAGCDRIACVVVDRYLPGAQHGLSMEAE